MSEKKLKEIGEFKIIKKIRKMAKKGKGVEVGIGDDAAVLDFKGKKLLATSDMLVEGVHFSSSAEPGDLGWKALAVSLSDIASMGGKPLFSLLSLSLPPYIEEEWIEQFLRGWKALAEMFSVSLVGGDISQAEKIAIDSIVLGEVEIPILRRGARVGDKIFITGFVGDSAAGLWCLQRQIEFPSLTRKHLRPLPRVKEGQWIGKSKAVHSMIDISDGLAGDLGHICEESERGAVIFAEKLPLSSDLLSLCRAFSLSPLEFALFGGEDYELLLTADADISKELGFPLYEIGEVIEDKEMILIEKGEKKRIERRGFEHFKEIW